MPAINYLTVLTAAVAAFVEGALWYTPLLFGKQWMALRGLDPEAPIERKVPVATLIIQFGRDLVVAYVLAWLIALLGVAGWLGAVQLAALVWIGFQATLLLGAVIHEKMPWKLYLIHEGDALVKILLMAVIIGLWS